MGEMEDARVDLLKSAEIAQGLDDKTAAILAQNSIGYLYRELGAYDRALKAADQARALSEQAANGRGYRDAMELRGEVQLRTGRYDDALASYQEALAQDQADSAGVSALADEIAIAGVRVAKGDNQAARAALHALAPRARASSSNNTEVALLTTIAHSFEKENPDSAMHYYELALSNLETQGEKIGGAELQTGYLSGKNRYYFEEVARYYASRSAADPAWSERAFHTMERAKARGLLDLLRTSVSTSGTAEENAALDALYSLDPAYKDYANQRAALEEKYLDLRRARVDAAVAGIAPGRDVSTVVTLAQAGRALPKKTVLLEFALGDSASLLWVVQRDKSELYKLPPRSVIEPEVQRLRDAIARPGSGDADMLKTARALYRTLLEPGQQQLDKAQTIVVVPDGALFELPFDALLRGDAQPGTPISGQWFVARKWDTVCAPSATVYVRLRAATREQKYAHDLFAVGNPDFTTIATAGNDPLAPLPYAQKEVEAIGATVKPERRIELTGKAASEAAVKQELRTESPRVVHLATHGLVDAIEPARSSVALASGDGEDGLFHTLEIVSTPTKSDLVVMSACESARGRVSRGEGVVGLSRAFLGAGAESVVASLWSVSDESTAELMRVFYERMFGKKESASRALQEARIALLDSPKFSHPFYWSPFVVTGTERSPW
jgi:CHAT domain-containing protein